LQLSVDINFYFI